MDAEWGLAPPTRGRVGTIDRRGQHDATRGFERQGLLGARGWGSAASADVMGGWANERGEGRRGRGR